LLDGVPYFQVVFTLPKELSRLALGNRKTVFDMLFAAAWRALKKTIALEHGYEPAALMVLHTWDQKLDAHIHVHALVPGGGPARDGSRWCASSPSGRYLVDADQLRAAYRETFLRRLHGQWRLGHLKLTGEFASLHDETAWKGWLTELRATNWVSYIEPPPAARDDPQQVVKYLARYLTGGPISDSRIVRADERQVTFLARAGTTPGGDREQTEVTLPVVEFVRRWSLHILPHGYTKSRRFGGWSGRRCEPYLELCSQLLESAGQRLSPGAMDFGPFDEVDAMNEVVEASYRRCPECGDRLIPQAAHERSSWSDIMSSPHRPAWYRTLIGR
jgi:hypothetical protein